MTVFRKIIEIQTRGREDMTDLSSQVAAIVAESGIQQGLAHVFNVGSTASIGTIEFEPGLEQDFPDLMRRIAPPSRSYHHEETWHDGNGHSHLQATLMGPGVTLPVEGGALMTGTWQQIFHYEADIKPRRRQIVVTVMGE